MSALIAVGSLLMVAVLPGGPGGNDLARGEVTRQRMHDIEAATHGFMAANLRRPCPASLTEPIGSEQFGMEQVRDSECAGEAGTSEYSGMPAVTTLGLSVEHAFDGWGRRLQYRVDRRATVPGATALSDTASSCFDLQSQGTNGSIEIASGVEATLVFDRVMWALMSHGKDKYGSYSMAGNGPIDGATDADTLKNIALEGRLIRREPSEQFDDIVWYGEQSKNTCCLGKACALGFSADLASAGTADTDAGVTIAKGDVNGDGIQDLVLGNAAGEHSRVVVAYGSRTGWPVRQSLDLSAITSGDGSPGFVITDDSSISDFGKSVATGDVNGDGYDDIVVGGSIISVVFGGPASASEVVTSSLNGASGLLIDYGATVIPGTVATGDIDGDGMKDILFAQYLADNGSANYLFGIWGRRASDWCALVTDCDAMSLPKTWTTDYSTITITNGFSISGLIANNPIAQGYSSMVTGDANGDSIDDILIGGYRPGSTKSGIYMIFGQTRDVWTNDVGWISGDPYASATITVAWFFNTSGPTYGVKFMVANGATTSSSTPVGHAVALADTNNDGFKDLIAGSDTNVYIYHGRKAGSWTAGGPAGSPPPVDLSAQSDVILDTRTRQPSWIEPPAPNMIRVGDINSDGRNDLLLGVKNSGTPAGCLNDKTKSAGSVYVLIQPARGWASASLFSGVENAACDANELNAEAFAGSFRIDGAAAYDYAFLPLVMDVNADGRDDLLITAPGDVANRSGMAYVLLGRRRVPWESVVDLSKLTPE